MNCFNDVLASGLDDELQERMELAEYVNRKLVTAKNDEAIKRRLQQLKDVDVYLKEPESGVGY